MRNDDFDGLFIVGILGIVMMLCVTAILMTAGI